jgi:putative spermidine/putrescine transport system ATP-binding protein
MVPGGSIPGLAIPADFSDAVVSARPEDVRLVDPDTAAMRGRVSFVRDLGATVETYVACDDHEIVAISTPRERPDLREGDEVGLEIDPEKCVVLTP